MLSAHNYNLCNYSRRLLITAGVALIGLIFLVVASAFASPGPAATVNPSRLIPALPDLALKGYILVDANSGYVIAEKNADVQMPPASITKVMSLYLVAKALKTESLHFDDRITISKNAWKVGGSKMFIKVGDQVSVKDLVDGIVIASGNDATVAMAEHMAGSEEVFANLMTQTAKELGMNNTNYVDSNGLPATNHYSTPRDIALLARAWINHFPEYYPWFKQKWVIHNGIKQPNRNRLLWRDSSVDGIKTGHTDDAGYCLVSSAVRNGMRLIAVVMGASSDNARNNNSEILLNYGFRFYETHKIYTAGIALTKTKIWLGEKNVAELGLSQDLYVTIPSGQYKKLKASLTMNKIIKAPLQKGHTYGSVNVMIDNKLLTTQPLVALQDIHEAGLISSLCDRLFLLFYP